MVTTTKSAGTPATKFRRAQSPISRINLPPGSGRGSGIQASQKGDNLKGYDGLGTIDSPWIIYVDTNHPKRNREFNITFVEGIKDRNHIHNAFHICKIIPFLDQDMWKATIPETLPSDLALFYHRSILITGASRNFWFRTNEHYHLGNFCKATATAHSATQVEIDGDVSKARESAHWLLLFPENVVLDNSVFSSGTKLNTEYVHMKDQVLTGTAVYFQIAVQGGRQVEKAKKTKILDAKLAYGF